MNNIANLNTQTFWQTGVYVFYSNDNLLMNNNMNNNSYGLYIVGSNNNLIKNSDSSQNSIDIYVTSESINTTVLNCSYDISKEQIDSDSSLIRKWYYRAYVNDSSGNYIAGADVSAYNISNSKEFEIITDETGWTDITSITDYINNGGTRRYYSLYAINVTNGTLSVSHNYNVTQLQNNFEDVFTLI